jgi:hypothetical protein
MFERFSHDARLVVVGAQEEARERGHNFIGGEHLLLALLRQKGSAAVRALEAMGVDLADVRAQVDAAIGTGSRAPSGHIPFTPSAKRVLECALREALQLEDTSIGTEHVLLGIVREREGVAASVLMTYGVDLERARAAVVEERGEGRAVARDRRPAATSPAPTPWRRPTLDAVPRCALCGRDATHVERMLVSRGVRLCADCARAAVAQLDALPDDAPALVRFDVSAPAPADRAAAIVAIERAFDAVLSPLSIPVDDALAFLEGGERSRDLLETFRQIGASSPTPTSDQTVEWVRFLGETDAEVSLGLWFPGSQQPRVFRVQALLEDGSWKVSRSTVEHFVRLAREHRPPPPP